MMLLDGEEDEGGREGSFAGVESGRFGSGSEVRVLSFDSIWGYN